MEDSDTFDNFAFVFCLCIQGCFKDFELFSFVFVYLFVCFQGMLPYEVEYCPFKMCETLCRNLMGI